LKQKLHKIQSANTVLLHTILNHIFLTDKIFGQVRQVRQDRQVLIQLANTVKLCIYTTQHFLKRQSIHVGQVRQVRQYRQVVIQLANTVKLCIYTTQHFLKRQVRQVGQVGQVRQVRQNSQVGQYSQPTVSNYVELDKLNKKHKIDK